MSATPPKGSKIEVSFHKGYETITIPHSSGGVIRYFAGIFMLFWLGGWISGGLTTIGEITDGKADVNAFDLFWLGGWAVSCVFVVYFLYRMFRKSVSEKLLLNRSNLTYDSGIPPVHIGASSDSKKNPWSMLFAKREKVEFQPREVKSLRLREVEAGNRLTIDNGDKRLEIGHSSTEVEREWLYEYLQRNYS